MPTLFPGLIALAVRGFYFWATGGASDQEVLPGLCPSTSCRSPV